MFTNYPDPTREQIERVKKLYEFEDKNLSELE